jgi:hypothetical protein
MLYFTKITYLIYLKAWKYSKPKVEQPTILVIVIKDSHVSICLYPKL